MKLLKPIPSIFFVLFLAIVSVPGFVAAQQLDMTLLESMKPRNIGPGGMSGRVTTIDVVTKDPDIIYAGTASGGLWKSISGGIAWEPIFDSVRVLSIGAVAIDQRNPDVVWAGTGEGNPRNSVTGGFGLYKSLDAGKTWKLVGLENTRNIHRIIVDKFDSDIVYVGAIGSSWGEHEERGVYKTMDGGKTWQKILYVNERTGVADLVVDPTNPNKLIAAMWEHQRQPWTFTSGGEGSGIYITLDGGENWQRLGEDEGLPKDEMGRVGLAIAPSEPNRIYALVESKKNGLYRSDDGGTSWKMINDQLEGSNGIGNRPFYYSDLFVDPVNENRLYSVFTYIHSSEDGGKSFSLWAKSYGSADGIHPDHHAFWIHPEDPNYIIEGNDGGLNISRDRGKSWRFAENIPVAQFYHINTDNEVPYNVYGGMQDNGSWAGPAYVFKSGGIRNSYWQEVMFGDGFDAIPDPDDSRYGYAMSQQGNVGRYDRETGHVESIKPTHPDPDVTLRFNWNSAIALDPFDSKTLYFGSQFVHKSLDKGNTWDIISGDLTTNDPEKQKQYESGGLTMDATGAENHTTILAIEPSPLEQGVLWVGTDDGLLHITRDGGSTWTKISDNINGLPQGAWIPQIRASRHRKGEAYVIVNNYRNFDFKPYLFRTRDYGATWESLVGEDNIFGYTLALAQDPIEPNLLFLGTEHGLYVSIDEGANWTKWTNGYPSVSTMDLDIHEREHDLIMGTFGRAAWVLDDIRPLRELAKNGSGVLKQTIKAYPAPDSYLAAYQQASGTRFAGNAIYLGENREYGAMLSYSVYKEDESNKEDKAIEETKPKKRGKKKKSAETTAPETKEETPTSDMDSIHIRIYKADGTQIRHLKQKYENNGLQRIYWSMNEAGVRRPSRRDPRTNASEPGGVQVVPGEYKVVFSFGEQKDSTTIKVLADPRLEISESVLQAKYTFAKTLEPRLEVAEKAMAQLRDSKSIIDEVKNKLKGREGEAYDSLQSHSKEVLESIDQLMDELVGPESDKQGIVSFPERSIMSYLNQVSRYLRSSLQAPGATEERLKKQGDEKLAPWVDQVNSFFSDEWTKYRQHVENTDLSPFEDVEKFELK